MTSVALALALVLITVASASAQVDQLLCGLIQNPSQASPGALTEDRIAAGLKEALGVASGKACDLTGALDGYFKNQAIKILMPESLRQLGGTAARGQGWDRCYPGRPTRKWDRL